MQLNEVGIDPGLSLRDLSGAVIFRGDSKGSAGGMTVQTQLALDTATILDAKVTELQGQCVYDAASSLLILRGLKGEAYGGDVQGAVMVSFDGDQPSYDAVCKLAGLNIGPLMADRRHDEDTAGSDIEGLLNATFELASPPGQPDGRQGEGRVNIEQAQMYTLPVMLAILNVLHLTLPERGAFQDCKFAFTMAGNQMKLKDISLQGSAVALIGSGSMALDTQELDLDLLISTPHKALKIPLVTKILEGTARELFEVRVTGPLAEPKISTRPLSSLRRALTKFVPNSKE
jgi:hypothetical protein